MAEESNAQVTAVKDYIKRHDLEDIMSNAVNEAIKLDSDDPCRVISEYVLKYAKARDDDYSDDDDDVMAEGEEPVMQKGRRQQVAAKKFEAPANWTAPKFDKEPAEHTFLIDTMESNKLMKNLAPSDREMLAHAFKKVSFASGTDVIKQGDEGNTFYVLYSGSCDISVAGKGSVMKATKGIAFGELALLHNAPRAATVTAEENVDAFELDEVSFKMILMGKSQQDGDDYNKFLKEVTILKHLPTEDIQTLAGCLKEVVYPEGKNVICEGDAGNTFFVIRDGEVKCTKVGSNTEVSNRLVKGDFFGELALINDDKRAATVTTVQKTTLLKIERNQFVNILGKLEPPNYDAVPGQ